MMDDFLERKAVIKVFGVGGCGCSSVQRMVQNKVRGVKFIAVNTDVQSLKHINADKWIAIGRRQTGGLGAGTNPEIGRLSALEQAEEIEDEILGSDLVFVTAGMGGGTGTGAAPVVAEIAKKHHILTLGVVTLPFFSEGKAKMSIALKGVEILRKHCDSLILIPNERIFSIIDANTLEVEAYREIDKYLRTCVQGIAEAVTFPGQQNVDMNDIKKTFKGKGTSFVGIGIGSGPNRAVKAIRSALHSKMVPTNISSATDLIVITTTDPANATMYEIQKVMSEITSIVPVARIDETAVKYGSYHRTGLNDDYIVTVIATGFDSNISSNDMATLVKNMSDEYHIASNFDTTVHQEEEPSKINQKVNLEEDDLDIPTWLKKKN
ncbi:MAG: cell division protein FtsZ [Acholeplasmatales bacterium]|jgi:cell division protein FtsZ|nr:cell division protein FtsZ [Acholeplasmatales bacterium]